MPPLPAAEVAKPDWWLRSLACVLAGWLHLHVFFRSLDCLTDVSPLLDAVFPAAWEARSRMCKAEVAVAMAYTFDVLLLQLGVIP